MKNLLVTTIAIFGLALFTNAQVPNYIPTNGLVGWWPFNGNANDETGNGNNGTTNGSELTEDRFGLANSAYSFDGVDDFIECENINLPAGNSSRTFSAWFYLTPTIGYDDGYGIISYGSNTFSYGRLNDINIKENCIWFNSHILFYDYTPSENLSNNWHNIVVTYDNADINSVKFYFNSVELNASINNPENLTELNTLNTSMLFGRVLNLYASYFYFNGKIDDIAIYNRALTQQEIEALYNAPNCSNNLTISPVSNQLQTGNTATFSATTSDTNPNFIWQSDLGQGFQTLNNYGNYSGVNSNALSISNLQLSNHNQPIRAISTSGNCIDTSNIATIQIADTCITNVTVYDTLLTTVIDTLLINTTLSLPVPNNENTILIYPNPASDHITIDNGNFAAMTGFSIKITNNSGQEVFMNAINQAQFYVDLSTWTGNGLYFVHLIDSQNNTVTVRKIVFQ